MKALVYTGPYALEWKDVPDPLVGPEDVLVRPRAVAICGSDLNGYRGKNSMRVPPLIMGHEFSGEAVRAGDRAGVPPGTRVVVNPALNCGTCGNCLAGRINICEHRTIIGTTMPAGPRNGAMAEYVAVPARAVLPLPNAVSFEEASLIEPLAVSLHAVKKAGDLAGRTVAVIGAGPIGLLTLLCAAAQKPAKLHCIDLVESRLDKARRAGATAAYRSDAASAAILDATGGMGVDVVLDAAAFAATVGQAIEIVRNGGHIVIVGMGTESIPFPIKRFTAREIRMEGSYTFTTEVRESLELIPKLDAAGIVTSRFDMADGLEAFKRLDSADSGDIKIVLTNPPA